MNPPIRIAAFVTALAAVFALAWGGGRLVGPIDTGPIDTGPDNHERGPHLIVVHRPGGRP